MVENIISYDVIFYEGTHLGEIVFIAGEQTRNGLLCFGHNVQQMSEFDSECFALIGIDYSPVE